MIDVTTNNGNNVKQFSYITMALMKINVKNAPLYGSMEGHSLEKPQITLYIYQLMSRPS